MTKEQYGLWKHEPVTKWFFDYLIAKQAFLKTTAQEMWLDGQEPSQAVRGQIIEIQEIIDLPFEAITAFYEEKDGTESQDIVSQAR